MRPIKVYVTNEGIAVCFGFEPDDKTRERLGGRAVRRQFEVDGSDLHWDAAWHFLNQPLGHSFVEDYAKELARGNSAREAIAALGDMPKYFTLMGYFTNRTGRHFMSVFAEEFARAYKSPVRPAPATRPVAMA